MKFFDLDYFQVKSGIIFIVRGNSHPEGKVLCCPVYWPDENGDRIGKSGQKYRKEIIEVAEDQKAVLPFVELNREFPRNVFLIPITKIIKVYKPKSVVKKFKSEFSGTIWSKIFQVMIDTGISESDIGIFGSYLVGLDKKIDGTLTKDIDFLIYGQDNCRILKSNFNSIFEKTGLKTISNDHIKYESKKLGGMFNQKLNSFEKTLKNKWSSIQVKDRVLTTIRFVKKSEEMTKNLLDQNPIIGSKKVTGIVIDDFGANFVPRFIKIFDGQKVWQIATNFWVHHQFVKNGDKVEIFGNLHQKNNLISIDQYSQGVKIIGGENEVLFIEQGNVYPAEIGRGRAEIAVG